jgi:AcrR family transcriptional regulator
MSPTKRAPETTDALRASLVDHARALIARSGASALTMRALADEAGCAVGLAYKVFADRHDLVVEICTEEFRRLAAAYEETVDRASTATVGANLTRFAELLLDSPAVALAQEIHTDHHLGHAVTARVHETGIGPATIEHTIARYLTAEKAVGRVDQAVDEDAVAFLLAGAVHNLIVSGDAWPRPTRAELRRRLDALATTLQS